MLAMDHIEAPALAGLELDGGAVAVIGAYKGDTVAFIREHHPNSQVLAYEPQIWAFNELTKRFGTDPKVHRYNYGLGIEHDDNAPLYEYGTDAGSLLELPGWRSRDYVRIVDAEFIHWGHPTIALCVMNIEGSEYKLIPYLLANNFQPDKWLIQFHFHRSANNVPDRMWDEYTDTQLALADAAYRETPIGRGWELWQR